MAVVTRAVAGWARWIGVGGVGGWIGVGGWAGVGRCAAGVVRGVAGITVGGSGGPRALIQMMVVLVHGSLRYSPPVFQSRQPGAAWTGGGQVRLTLWMTELARTSV